MCAGVHCNTVTENWHLYNYSVHCFRNHGQCYQFTLNQFIDFYNQSISLRLQHTITIMSGVCFVYDI